MVMVCWYIPIRYYFIIRLICTIGYFDILNFINFNVRNSSTFLLFRYRIRSTCVLVFAHSDPRWVKGQHNHLNRGKPSSFWLLHPFNILLSKLGMLEIYKPPTCRGILQNEEDQKKKHNISDNLQYKQDS